LSFGLGLFGLGALGVLGEIAIRIFSIFDIFDQTKGDRYRWLSSIGTKEWAKDFWSIKKSVY